MTHPSVIRPNDLDLDGVFGKLANVAWTSAGPSFSSST